MLRGFKNLASAAARAADVKKGEEILLLDVHRHSGLTDYLLLVSVHSPAQLEAVEKEISDMMNSAGVELLHRDGPNDALWRVLDYGGLMVHLMYPAAREFYALDRLYHDAPHRRWTQSGPKKHGA